MKRFFALAAAVLIALTAAAPYLLKAVNGLVIGETSVDVSSYTDSPAIKRLKKGDYVLFGTYLGEPILWQTLKTEADGRVLMLTHYVIAFKAFDAGGENAEYHKADSEKYGSSVWEDCTLKEWLNSDEALVSYSHCLPEDKSVFGGYNGYSDEKGFLHEDNFPAKLREMIGSNGVFLPGKKLLNELLVPSQRVKSSTKSALLANESPYVASGMRPVWYWTSSPVNSNNVSVTTVTSSGGYYKALAYDGLTGVAPALYLNDAAVLCIGDGTFDRPYLILGGAVE